jgi:hypothetical protein
MLLAGGALGMPQIQAQCVARDICSELETASGTAAGAAIDGRRFIFGLGYVNGRHWPQFQDDIEKAKAWNRVNMDSVLAAGSTTVTIGLDWLTVEATQGTYDWSYTDHQVIEAEKRGLEPFAYTGNTPNWALLGRPEVPNPNAAVCPGKFNNAIFPPAENTAGKQAFKNFHKALAQRYCGRVKYYEFWNEPNGCSWMSCGCGDQTSEMKAEYARWLRRWYQAMKEGCADTALAVGGLDCNWGNDPQHAAPWCQSFVDTLYDNGAGAAFDAVALHPYGYGGDLQVALAQGKQLNWAAIDGVTQSLANHGDADKRLWLNEWGFRTGNDALKAQLVSSTLERLANDYANVFEAQYLVVTDLPDGSPWGLAASNTSTNPPTVTPRGSWYAFRDSVLGVNTRRIGPRNPGMEFQGDIPSAPYSPIPEWGPNGGWDFHRNVPRPGRGVLGRKLGFYSAGLTETFGQTLDVAFKPEKRYCFRSAAQGGLDDTGVVPYQIGYGNSQQTFVALRTKAVAVGGAWTSQGVCYNTGTSGPELNQPVVVRFGRGVDGGASDVWFDNLLVTMKPLP